MTFDYPCEDCKLKDICSRFATIQKKLNIIRQSEYKGWPTGDWLNLGDRSDTLIFEFHCQYFSNEE